MTNTLIQSCISLTTTPRMYRLADALKLPRNKLSSNVAATTMMAGLWLWAAKNAPDGNLTDCPLQAIADASNWCGKPETFFNALLSSGWVDEADGEYCLHNWEEYKWPFIELAGKSQETSEASTTPHDARKENNRIRQRRFRDKQKLEQNKGAECSKRNVTESVTSNVTSVTESVTSNVTSVTPSVTEGVTGNVTGVTESVTHNATRNVTEERGNVERSNINNNLNNNYNTCLLAHPVRN